MRSWGTALLSCVLLSGGCRSASVRPSGDNAAALARAQMPPSRTGIDDDRDLDRPDPILAVLVAPLKLGELLFDALIALPKLGYQYATGDTAHRAVLLMGDHNSADNRRIGINRLLEFSYTKRPPYTTYWERLGEYDQDSTVRAAALRACNRARDRKATPVFIKALSYRGRAPGDESELVRLEGAKGLANVPDANAVGPLVKAVADPDESREVRIAAADALKYYRTLEVAGALSHLLADRDFSVAWQARRSLVYMTHRDFGRDESAWLGYFAGPDKPLG